MYCHKCGKENVDGAAFCNSCGTALNTTTIQANNNLGQNDNSDIKEKKIMNTMCLIGFIISLISLILNFWGIVGIAGTVVSAIGLSQCEKKKEGGKSLAIAGLCVGGFSIIFGAFTLLAMM